MRCYGATGPYAQRAEYDVIGAAEGGLMHITSEPDGPPDEAWRRADGHVHGAVPAWRNRFCLAGPAPNRHCPGSRQMKKSAQAAGLLTCTWPGCPSTRPFQRQADLNRHVKKHTREAMMDCPVLYCPRRGRRSFYRADKLREHLRNGHSDATSGNANSEFMETEDPKPSRNTCWNMDNMIVTASAM
ncbi:hypothetical protein VTN77DRAFT_579 [Rasamsonia byssochlamydoides]|uniref:uncharacterized protein n=1 Tax=Rasamsonia byssochlamydoides TaxID=89139 RepID=UPI003743ED0C